ncbi:MDR family MFS transporter [Clostridium saccharoperbutylacetonicum]|uniref:MDR family MFS transporter n=1 Tax=Clostridium saccharoperbutylacetonicum TaxID=36745 RepID=UPI0039EA9D99
MTITNLNKKTKIVIIIGVMLGILLASLDGTIVATAMPKIINSLKGFDYYTWPMTAYLLCMTISMPLFGKLADIYGFKPIYIFGIAIFLAGSVLCGISQNMLQFIVFRGLQGIGGGILISNAMAIIGILFAPAERAKYGGFVSSAAGLSSLIGPILGGLITDNLSWRWIFYVNVPLGIIAMAILICAFPSYKETQERKKIDYMGAASLIISLVPMLLALTWGGKTYAWSSIQIIGILVFSIIMLVVFGFIETKASDPIIPMSLFQNSIFNFSAIEMFLLNAVLMGSSIFIPLFLQGVIGSTASKSGAIITPMLVSLIVGVITTGLLVSKTCKYKVLAFIGFVIMSIGTVLLSLMGVKTGSTQVVMVMVIMGIGIGTVMNIFNVTAQNAFSQNQIGVVTSSIQFFSRMGQTIASTVLGTIMSTSMSNSIHNLDISSLPANVTELLKNPNTISNSQALNAIKDQIPEDMLPSFGKLMEQIKQILSNSIHQVFVICAVITITALIIVLFMKEIPLKSDLG